MYKRILLPTDGSEASQRAILAGVRFAREIGAEVIGLHVTPAFHVLTADSAMLEDTPEEFAAVSAARAHKVLGEVERAALETGVPCRLEHASSDDAHEAIVETARRLDCDLIVMASHGRRGIRDLLLGNETQKVLVHSAIPVLVHR